MFFPSYIHVDQPKMTAGLGNIIFNLSAFMIKKDMELWNYGIIIAEKEKTDITSTLSL